MQSAKTRSLRRQRRKPHRPPLFRILTADEFAAEFPPLTDEDWERMRVTDADWERWQIKPDVFTKEK